MTARWKKYVWLHVVVLLGAVTFAVYAILMRALLPGSSPHCLLHDLLHLYCPFCGGTRAFFALLRFDLLAALRFNAAAVLAVLFALALDVRALVLLCKGSEKPLLPRGCWRVAVGYFWLYGLLLNTAMLFGLDPIGDLVPYWQALPLWRAALFLPLAVLVTLSAFRAILAYVGSLPHGLAWACCCAALSITLAFLLFFRWWLWLLCLPAATVLYLLWRKRKRI